MSPGAPKPNHDDRAGWSAASVKTLVVTDLVGSTRLFSTLGDLGAAHLSAQHERLARDLVWECGGREIDKTDGFLLLFDRALDAVRFSLAYHRALAELSKSEKIELAARVGIHLGEIYERRNPPEDVARGAKPIEIEGVAKPVAARVMALAEGRQTLLTRTAFDLARQGAASEPLGVEGTLRWLAHGPYQLKGVDEPVEIFEVGVSGFAPLIVPKSTAKARRAVSEDDELTLGWRPAPGLEVPRRTGWYLAEKLGEGGFGEVWLGRHSKTGEHRVFKFCYRAERLRSLQREVTLFRLLKETLGARSDIARILDWNFDHAPYFLESEYTEGGNLLEWAAEQGGAGQVPIPVRLELLAQVAEALAAAHSVGVLHKDVKPSNVLVTAGDAGEPHVRLTDFGIGVITDRGVLAERGITLFELTEMVAEDSGSAGGTHLYMAPELVEGRAPTVQADIYALGVMLYQFLVGDFSRALAPGWRRDVEDEILREDLAVLVDGHPDRRLRDAREVAERLRTVEERRALAAAEQQERAEREAERRALEQAHRRRKLSALIASGTMVVLFIVSLLAYQAEEARKEADRRRAQAESLIGFMVGDLRDKLEPIGRLDLLDEVGDQALAYFDAVPADDLTDDEVYRRSQALYQIGEVRAKQGNLGSALEAYEESLVLAQRLVDRKPNNGEWLKALGASHFGVGYVYWRQNLLDDAERHFRAYLEVAERLATMDPDNPEWRLEVAYTHSNIGSVLQARGDLQGALDEFQKTLAIKKDLAERHPASSKYRLELAKSHNIAGSVLESLGRLDEARSAFQADLALKQKLVASDPSNAQWRQQLAVSHNLLSSLEESRGALDAAAEHADTARKIMVELVAQDADNRRWRRELAFDRLRTASVLEERGAFKPALSECRQAVEILEGLVKEEPSDARWQIDHADALRWLGTMLLRTGRPEEAIQVLDHARSTLLTQLNHRPDDRQAARLEGLVFLVLGQVELARGSLSAAEDSWSHAAGVLKSLVADSRDHSVLDPWARTLIYLGRPEEARPVLDTLWSLGYRNPDLVALCRDHGIAFGPGDGAAHDQY